MQQDTLGKTLKSLREAKGLTLKEAADTLEVDLSMLAKIEKGQRSVSDALFGRLADLFEVKERVLRTLSLADQVYRDVEPHEFASDALRIVQRKIKERKQ